MASIPERVLRQAKSRDFRPSVRIGKSGITETVIDEISNQLKSKELVKIKPPSQNFKMSADARPQYKTLPIICSD